MSSKYFVEQGSIYAPGWHVRERVRDNYLRSLGCFEKKADAEEYLAFILAEESREETEPITEWADYLIETRKDLPVKTNLTEAKLVELRIAGVSYAMRQSFIDPYTVAQCSKVLDRRGEQWAASVLGRDISGRSIAASSRPYLTAGEPYTLCAADRTEDNLILAELEK